MKQFVDAAERLAEVLTMENEALKRMDFVGAVALVPVKEAALGELMKQPRRIVAEPLALLAQRLSSLASENQSLLEHAIAVQTRVVRIVARACAAPPPVARYGSHATPGPSRRSAAMALFTRA